MPAYQRGQQSPLEYYTRVLLALARREGGEIRIKCSEIDGVNEKAVLFTDYDPVTGELVLRAGSQFAEMLVISPEAAAWTKPVSEREQVSQKPKMVVPTDSDLAEIEAGLLRRAAQRRQTASVSTPRPQTS